MMTEPTTYSDWAKEKLRKRFREYRRFSARDMSAEKKWIAMDLVRLLKLCNALEPGPVKPSPPAA